MSDGSSLTPGWRALSVTGALYLGIAIALTWPLGRELGASIPADVGDPVLNTWILWWGTANMPFTQAWWNAPAFFPATGVIAFSEHLTGLLPIAAPVIAATGSPVAGYNVTFLLTFALSAMSAFALTTTMTGRRDAGFIAGIAFGFSPYRVAQWSHLQVLASFWLPVVLLALHRYRSAPRARWLALLATALVMQPLANAYYLVFLPLLVGLWCVWFLRLADWRMAAGIGAAAVVAMVALSPLLSGYREVHSRYGLTRNLDQMRMYSADLLSIVTSSGHLSVWPALVPPRNAETALFPGFCVLGLCAAGAVALVARRREGASGAPAGDPSVLAFYLVSALLVYVFALGPSPVISGDRTLGWGPYSWLAGLPGFASIRAPARLGMLVTCCLAVAASIGFARLTHRLSTRTRSLMAVAVGAVMLAETWPSSLPIHEPPRSSEVVASDLSGPLLVVPVLNELNEAAAMYRSMAQQQPLVNGYSGHIPPWYLTLREALNDEQPAALEALSRAGVRNISVVKRQDREGGWRKFVSTRARLLRETSDAALFELSVAPALPSFTSAVRVAAIHASPNPQAAPNLLDGRAESTWYTPHAQSGGETLEIDLGSVQAVSALELTLADAFHFPRQLQIELTVDGSNWTPVWSGATSALALDASLRSQQTTAPMVIAVGDHAASRIRLRQTGHHRRAAWSLAEVKVLRR